MNHAKENPKIPRDTAEALFMRAEHEEDQGKLRSALRLFLAAAKAGDINAQSRVGYYYDVGQGVRPDRTKALYWYTRASRRGDEIAAHNIGTIWRDDHDVSRAARWFQRAVDLGSHDSNLDIAKLYIEKADDPRKAMSYLKRLLLSAQSSKPEKSEASRLLKSARKKAAV